MENSTFENLRKKWSTQRELFQQWNLDLIQSSFSLRSAIREKLGVDEIFWKDADTNEDRSYVELSKIIGDKSEVIEVADSTMISEDGGLIFGISITLDHQSNSYPKGRYNLPVVIQYFAKELKYNFWDVVEEAPEKDSNWLNSEDDIANKIIERLDLYFSFDPKEGVNEKNRIGFISEQ